MGFFDSSKSTNNNTTQNYDNRQVITNTSTAYDLSDRSVNNSVNTTTTNITDGGAIKSMADVATAAIKGVPAAYDYADHIFDAATVFANNVNKSGLDAFSQAASLSADAITNARAAYQDANKSVANAYDGATSSILKAFQSAQVATADAQAATQSAYADAKGTTGAQKQIIIAIIAVAGLMALAAMHKG